MGLKDMRERIAAKTDTVIETAKGTGEKAADAAVASAKAVADGARKAHHDMRVNYYNPVFPEDYIDSQFDLPDVIVIEDEDRRKGIDVCEGSIGWLSKEAGIEVFYLYKEAIPYSGLNFFPIANLDAVYYSDPFDKKRFIDLSSYYEVIQNDKLTELKNIAHALGARECRLEYHEDDKRIRRQSGKGAIKVKDSYYGAQASVSVEQSFSEMSESKRTVLFQQKFEGSDNPTKPSMSWYANDRELLSLIDMRCSNNPVKESIIQIDASLSCTMSIKRACKLDATLKKLGAVGNFSLESEAETEARRHLLYYIKF